jgi:hypothetical protein
MHVLGADDKLLSTPNERCDTYNHICILPLKSARFIENNKNTYMCVVFRGYPSRILIVILHSTALRQIIFCIIVIFSQPSDCNYFDTWTRLSHILYISVMYKKQTAGLPVGHMVEEVEVVVIVCTCVYPTCSVHKQASHMS